MTARAHVFPDFSRPGGGVSIWMVRDVPGGVERLEPTALVVTRMSEEEMAAQQEPSLRLPEDIARALLDALARHFGGVSDVQTLRQDYLAERARVDKMIGHLTDRPMAG